LRTAVIGVCCLLGACASYDPQPLSVAGLVEDRQAQVLDPVDVHKRLVAIAPSTRWDGEHWDELSLFAAALEYRPDLKAARAAAETAAANAEAARVRPGPSFALLAEYAFHPPESSNWQVAASADQLIDAGGRRRARIGSADVAARAAEFAYRDALWVARAQVAAAISDLIAATRTVDLETRLAGLRTRQLAAVRNRVREGLAPRLDLELVQAARAADALAAAQARAAADTARITLAGAVGVASGSLRELTVSAPPLAQRADVPGLPGSALEARLDIFDAMAAYDQAEEALRQAVAAQYPEVHIGPGYAWERGLSKLPFTLTLSFPSADLGKAGIAAAEAGRREAARRLEAAVANAEQDIDRARAEYEAADEELTIARDQALPAAHAVAEQAARAIDAGAMDRAGWANASVAAVSAEIDLTAAERRCRLAQIALETAIRRPLADPAMREAIDNARRNGDAG